MQDCLFCKIIEGQIPSKKIYEDEYTFAFMDINPQAKQHALVVPKKHIQDITNNNELSDVELAACLRACAQVAKILNIDASGFRISNNTGDDACQTVKHVHFHVMGGEKLSEKMA